MIQLGDAQQEALDACVSSLRAGRRCFTVGGYAGTGKTHVATRLFNEVSGGAVCAFCGKAANVLRSRGLPATTIHKLIYEYDKRRQRFFKKLLLDCEWILVDEGSMIAIRLWEDLRSFRLPIVVFGDCGQLEPVGDDPRLMARPDVLLDQIYRQDEDSTIVEFATVLRTGGWYGYGVKGDVTLAPSGEFWDDLSWADQMICAFNASRVRANAAVRAARGWFVPLVTGDRLVVLMNDYENCLWNGTQMVVNGITHRCDEYADVSVDVDDGRTIECRVTLEYLGSAKGVDREAKFALAESGHVPVDYAYCVTCHKAQGSQWDRVAVLEEPSSKWDMRRWSYTAATRASTELRYFHGRR